MNECEMGNGEGKRAGNGERNLWASFAAGMEGGKEKVGFIYRRAIWVSIQSKSIKLSYMKLCWFHVFSVFVFTSLGGWDIDFALRRKLTSTSCLAEKFRSVL